MNKEEALKKIEELKNYVEELEKEEENYCVGYYREISFNSLEHNLVFNNGCEVRGHYKGDGVVIHTKHIDKITLDDGMITVYFKGNNQYFTDEKIIWESEK